MTHLALRNTKRAKTTSASENNFGSELVALFTVLLDILLTWYRWIKLSLVNPHPVNYRKGYELIAEISHSEGEGDLEDIQPGTLVTARGIGLMAAYTGRRAMFAIYPASGEGLEVSSRGPAPMRFEYKKKDDLFLVGYVPPAPGKYHLQVARFGKKAIGSPYLLRVDDPPPGYVGNFGASLWHERPPRPPILSGIVDFVTEKMFLTEDGKLVQLNKIGTDMVPVGDTKHSITPLSQDRRQTLLENEVKELKCIEKPLPLEEAPCPKDEETKKNIPIKKQVMTRIENIMSAINRDSKKDPQEKYKYVSKALMKELSLSLKLLNMLGTYQENLSLSVDSPNLTKEYEPQEILMTEDSMRRRETEGCNQSEPDRFLSKRGESRYAVQRSAKLAWHWGDDAVISEACDATGQIEIMTGPTGQREGLAGSILQGARNTRSWRKYGVSGLLGLRKTQDLTGVRLLHNIYRPGDDSKETDSLKGSNKHSSLNNINSLRLECQNNIKLRSERNNLDVERRNPSVRNNSRKDVFLKPLDNTKNSTNSRGKFNRWKSRDLRANGTFRTLSLPDFNRILSLSVQGLRKAKSCGDRSFKALSSNSFSLSLRNLFDREQVYNLSSGHKQNFSKPSGTKEGPTLVKLTHYGSGRDSGNLLSGMKSVDDWKKYWEEKQIDNSETEFGKGCSLEITGIVDRGKAVFEGVSETKVPEIRIFDESKVKKITNKKKETLEQPKEFQNTLVVQKEFHKSPSSLTPSPVSNKTAFQKAKDMFEGNYNPNERVEEKDNRKKSISERYHVSSLPRDIQSGATPDFLGVPNRMPAVACFGSVYHPQYPHLPISPSRSRYYPMEMDCYVIPSWDIMLHSDPNYV